MDLLNGHKLNDQMIIDTLRQAIDNYQNGEIIEVRDTLAELVDAIDKFSKMYSCLD